MNSSLRTRLRTSLPNSSARLKLALALMKCRVGSLPRNQAGKRRDANSDLPCLGGTRSIKRSISPRSTRSNCSAICRCRPAVSYRGNVNLVNAIRLRGACSLCSCRCKTGSSDLASDVVKGCFNFIFRPSIDDAGRLHMQLTRQQRCGNFDVILRALQSELLDGGRAVLHPVGIEVRNEMRTKLVTVARLATRRIARLTWLPLKRLLLEHVRIARIVVQLTNDGALVAATTTTDVGKSSLGACRRRCRPSRAPRSSAPRGYATNPGARG